MKKSFAVFLGLALAAMCQFVLAAPAVVNALVGTAQAIPDTGSSRALRNGDSVNERDTIVTAQNSGLVLLFEDGQVAAIGANSRMTVTAYKYDVKEPAKGNVLLSLLTGSMRAVTGLIGKTRPENVAFRAGTATIGIRGSDVSFATEGGNVVVTVADGAIAFTFQGQTVSIPAGQAALTQDGRVTTGTVAAIKAAVASNAALSSALNSVSTTALENAVKDAVKAADDKAKAAKAAADTAAAALPPINSQPPVNNQPTCGANCSSPN